MKKKRKKKVNKPVVLKFGDVRVSIAADRRELTIVGPARKMTEIETRIRLPREEWSPTMLTQYLKKAGISLTAPKRRKKST